MLGFAGASYALFALVWTVLCLLSGAVVTDAMLRDQAWAPAIDVELQGGASEA